jgi:gluconokinase
MEKMTDGPGLHDCWVVMGVCGCGKSSVGQALAIALKANFIEGDDFHPSANRDKMKAGIPLTDADRVQWLQRLQAQIRAARAAGQGVVLSCSALKRHYRDVLRAAEPALRFAHLAGERDLIARRMQARVGHYMPLSLLDSQLSLLEPLHADEAGLVLDIRQPPTQLVDTILETCR